MQRIDDAVSKTPGGPVSRVGRKRIFTSTNGGIPLARAPSPVRRTPPTARLRPTPGHVRSARNLPARRRTVWLLRLRLAHKEIVRSGEPTATCGAIRGGVAPARQSAQRRLRCRQGSIRAAHKESQGRGGGGGGGGEAETTAHSRSRSSRRRVHLFWRGRLGDTGHCWVLTLRHSIRDTGKSSAAESTQRYNQRRTRSQPLRATIASRR
jgi:hypothetical protein